MPTRFDVNEREMLDYFEKLMDEVYTRYHLHPSNLPFVHLTDEQKLEIAVSGRIPNYLVQQVERVGGGYGHQHLNTSNGLPRK